MKLGDRIMPSYCNRCFHSIGSKLLRLRYSWTLCLVITAAIVVIFRMQNGHQQLIRLMKNAVVDDEMTNFPLKFTTTTSTTTSTPSTTPSTSPTTPSTTPTTPSTTSTTTPTTTPSTTTAPPEQTETFKSTCSAAADRRGPHQNVIGYSIYGGNFSEPNFYRKYLKPFTDTLRTIPIRYPGWVVRIYHRLKTDDVDSWKILNNILDLGSNSSRDHIDLCNATQVIKNRQLGDLFEMTWRWLPLLDDMVDILLSRDSDSPVFPREEDAVREWLATNKTFHIMRDHPAHCHFFVGCCWGVKIHQQRAAIFAEADKMFHENHLHQYDYDQQLLTKYYKSMANESMVAHDSYCCQVEKLGISQPYPSPRQNGLFVGWREVGQPMEALRGHCPEKCRPQNLTGPLASADWSFC